MQKTAPMRIIHCVRSPIGGIFRHIVDLATRQTEMGHEVGIVCDSTTGGAFEDAIIADVAPRLALGVRRFAMRRQITPGDIKTSMSLFATVASMKPDVLHGHGAKGGAYARMIGSALRLRGRKVLRLYSPHGGSLHYDAGSREGRIYFRLERMLERVTDGFVFVSDYEVNSYRAKIGVPRKPYCLTYNGLRPEEFQPRPPTAGMADIMFAGMMRDLKGPQVLIEALRILEDDYGLRPTARFVGAGEPRLGYEATVARLGLQDRVTFHDPMPTREALAQGRILVVPSLAESMPYLVLEGVAARIPLVATKVGGIPEIFGERANRLVPPGNAVALAAAIAAVLDHESAAFEDAMDFGAEIEERFSIARMATDITDFYDDLRVPKPVAVTGLVHRTPRVAGSLHTDSGR